MTSVVADTHIIIWHIFNLERLAGALIADTKTLLANWDLSLAVAENLDKFWRENKLYL